MFISAPLLSPGVANIPVNGVLEGGFIGRKVKFFQDKCLCLRIFVYPMAHGHLITVLVRQVENPAAGLVFIRADKRAAAVSVMLLPVEFLFPDILVQLAAGDSSVRSIGFCVVPDGMRNNTEQLVPIGIIPKEAHLGVIAMATVGFHLPDDGGIILLRVRLKLVRQFFMGRQEIKERLCS